VKFAAGNCADMITASPLLAESKSEKEQGELWVIN
jgi:hypothetical protein